MVNMDCLIRMVQEWSKEKGLHEADPKAQFMKLVEEVGEVAQAYTRDKNELALELGDLLVTVIIFAQQNDIEPVTALSAACSKISKRKGKMVDGVFVKEEDL